MNRVRTNQLFYITHIKNLTSILTRGILSHERVVSEGVEFEPVYDIQIVSGRRERKAPDGRSLWSFANLYFQPRNPMLYRVLCEKSIDDVVLIAVKRNILNRPDIFISTGNAASPLSEIMPADQMKRAFYQIKDAINLIWWKEEDGSKRKIMAECLVPDLIPPDYIEAVYVANYEVRNGLRKIQQEWNFQIIPEPRMFFEPYQKIALTPRLTLVQGDMFFSRMHTLTVSVNCVGVMGKGLASRAKYQFPDVYVVYQDLCRDRTLKMGKPYLYKRETSFDYQLADDPATLSNANSETWFLLFPTKRHWRERADIHGIEEGLQWLMDNYKKENITSLAIPALGCGLGWLQWRQVGPLLCRYLKTFDIKVWVYLPAERKVPDQELVREFLLGQG